MLRNHGARARFAPPTLRRIAVVGIVAGGLAACFGKDPYNPGTPLGTFRMTAALEGNTCGGEVPNPWTFDVKLSREGQTLYWIQGGLPIEARIDDSGAFSMQASGTYVARVGVDAGLASRAACSLTRVDTLQGVLDTAAMTTFKGRLAYTFGAAQGDCSDTVDQGGFATLPCSVQYAGTATKVVDGEGK